MKNFPSSGTRLAALAILLFAPVLLAPRSPDTSIEFRLEDGATKTKKYTTRVLMSLDDESKTVDGEDASGIISTRMTIRSTLTTSASDEYSKMRGGVPIQLRRTYGALTQRNSMEATVGTRVEEFYSKSCESTASSELENLGVLFDWEPSEETYATSFFEEPGDEEWLAGLTEDMDLRGLLPSQEVREGDEWTLPPRVLKSILTPGGDLKRVADDGAPCYAVHLVLGIETADFRDWFNEDLQGKVKAEFKGTREEDDGAEVAVIGITFKIHNTLDQTEQWAKSYEFEEGLEIRDVNLNLALEGDATLLWNMVEGCPHELQLSSELLLVLKCSSFLGGGLAMSTDAVYQFSGTMGCQASFE